MPDKKEINNGAVLAAVGAVLLWSFSGVCFRKGSELMGSMVYLTCMTAMGSFTAVLLHYFRGQPLSSLYRLPPRVLLSGIVGVAFYTVILATAFGVAAESDLGQINLLNLMWPVWVVVLGFIFLPDRPKPVLVLSGIILGLAGVMISRGIDQFTRLPADLTAPFLALTGGLLWSFYTVLLRKWKIPADKGGTAFNFAVCALMAGVTALFSGEWRNLPAWSWETVFWVLFGGVGPVGLAYSLWEIGVKKGPVFLIASLAFFIPIGSSLLIGLIFKESMNSGLLFGAVLIALGAWVINSASRNA
jgi:drug/metabolite transporter (DMT)-like permease